MDGAWTVDLQPLTATAQANLEYELWVDDRKAMVEKLTGGEIGYLHIKAMDAPSLLKFQEDLIENRGKKALIIDERFNGGGGIDQELLQILNQRKQYQLTRGRDATWMFPAPCTPSTGRWRCCRTSAPPATPRCSRTASARSGWAR